MVWNERIAVLMLRAYFNITCINDKINTNTLDTPQLSWSYSKELKFLCHEVPTRQRSLSQERLPVYTDPRQFKNNNFELTRSGIKPDLFRLWRNSTALRQLERLTQLFWSYRVPEDLFLPVESPSTSRIEPLIKYHNVEI